MKEQWRSSQSPEQEPPAAQQSEAIPGVDAAPEEISHEETVCEGCGRPYSHARKKELGKKVLKTLRAEHDMLSSKNSVRRQRGRAAFRSSSSTSPSLVKQKSGTSKMMKLEKKKAIQERKKTVQEKSRTRRYPPAGLATLEDLENNYIIRQGRTPRRSMLVED